LDFKVDDKILSLLNDLDKKITEWGGRIYLAKDSRMNEEVFDSGYPKADKFRSIREHYGMNELFNSLQSKRLNL